jgi:hypothetical protein
MAVRSTRLRYIRAKTAEDLTKAVDMLKFKVEIKGGPVRQGNKWIVFFVIPDEVVSFKNMDL